MKTMLSVAVLTAIGAMTSFAVAAEGVHLDGGEPATFNKDVILSTTLENPTTAVGLVNGASATFTGNADISAEYQGKSWDDTGAGVKADSGSKVQLGSTGTDHVNVSTVGSY